MKAVIHQPLGHVLDGDALELAQVEDALVRDQIAVALVEHREILLEPLGDVVGVEDRELAWLRSVRQPPIRRMYIQEIARMLALPHGAAEIGADALLAARR